MEVWHWHEDALPVRNEQKTNKQPSPKAWRRWSENVLCRPRRQQIFLLAKKFDRVVIATKHNRILTTEQQGSYDARNPISVSIAAACFQRYALPCSPQRGRKYVMFPICTKEWFHNILKLWKFGSFAMHKNYVLCACHFKFLYINYAHILNDPSYIIRTYISSIYLNYSRLFILYVRTNVQTLLHHKLDPHIILQIFINRESEKKSNFNCFLILQSNYNICREIICPWWRQKNRMTSVLINTRQVGISWSTFWFSCLCSVHMSSLCILLDCN